MKRAPNQSEHPKKLLLGNGATLLFQRTPHFRTAAVAVALLGGSRDEAPSFNGITHLLEHLLFKRTSDLGLLDIAQKVDELGGEVNAYTDPDSLVLYGAVPQSAAGELLSFLAALITDAQFTDTDVELEKEIVRQELLDLEDSSEEATYQSFRRAFWPESQLGFPVAGTSESVGRITPKDLRERLIELKSGSRLVIAVAGDLGFRDIQSRVKKHFGELPTGHRTIPPAGKNGTSAIQVARPANQTYLYWGYPCPGSVTQEYLHGAVLASLLGQGSSSYLFQSLREQAGVCYDISASLESYRDTSAFVIAGSFERKNLDRAKELIQIEIDKIVRSVSGADLERQKRMFLSQLELDEDSVRAQMWRMLECELIHQRHISPEEVKSEIGKLTPELLQNFAEHYLTGPNLLVLGGDIGP